MNHTSSGIEAKVTASDERHSFRECHVLVASIGRKPYALRLVRSVKNELEIVHAYKSSRGKRTF